MRETATGGPAPVDGGRSSRPAAGSKVSLFRYMRYQPFVMVVFYVCAEKIRDPFYFVVPELIVNTIAFYLMALLMLPVWFFVHRYQRRTAGSERGLLTTPEGWLRLTIGALPLSALWLVAFFVTGGYREPNRLFDISEIVLCALLASVVGTTHFIYNCVRPGASMSDAFARSRRQVNRWLAAAVALAFVGTLIGAHILLHMPDLPSSRRLLAKVVPVEVALKARNVYMFRQRGYLFAAGEPKRYHFRFDADPAVAQALVRAIIAERNGFEDSQDVEVEWTWAPDWWLHAPARHHRVDTKDYWFDTKNNRVYVAAFAGNW